MCYAHRGVSSYDVCCCKRRHQENALASCFIRFDLFRFVLFLGAKESTLSQTAKLFLHFVQNLFLRNHEGNECTANEHEDFCAAVTVSCLLFFQLLLRFAEKVLLLGG